LNRQSVLIEEGSAAEQDNEEQHDRYLDSSQVEINNGTPGFAHQDYSDPYGQTTADN
jgi:hypothetical protein